MSNRRRRTMSERGPTDPARTVRMIELRKDGATLQAIAIEYGISTERVRQIVHIQGELPATTSAMMGTLPYRRFFNAVAHVARETQKEQEHGVLAAYARGCHCAKCRAANTASHKDWRRRNGVAPHGSPEHRARLSVAMKGKMASQETRARLSAAMQGHEVSPETRAKISASLRKRAAS